MRNDSLVVAALRYPGVRTLLAFLFIYCLALQYGRTHFYRDPLSVFFDQSRAYTRWYSAFREQQANEYIETVAAAKGDGEITKVGPWPAVCANFMTTKRNGPQYIESSVGSVLQGLTAIERSDMYLSIFFTNTDPSVHPSWGQPWLENLVDLAYSYNVSKTELDRLERLEEAKSFKEKGVYDYVYALERCYDLGTDWIIIFEGDIIVADGWFVRTLQGLRSIEPKLGKSTKDWLFMRLFNQERSTGWSSRKVGGNNELWISFGIGLFVSAFILSTRRRSTAIKRHLDNWALAVICLIAIPSFVVLFFRAGKASMLPPSPGVKQEAFGCCSQAMVFPREQVPQVVEYLKEKKAGQVDLMLNDWSRASGLARLALYPVQAQHIGIQSIRGTTIADAQAIWSMAFENLDPSVLSREHSKMLKSVYGGVARGG